MVGLLIGWAGLIHSEPSEILGLRGNGLFPVITA